MVYRQLHLVLGFTLSFLPACGNKEPSLANAPVSVGASYQESSVTGLTEKNLSVCKSVETCPAADMGVLSLGTDGNKKLLGYVGEDVPWFFKGFDRNSKTRRVGVLLNNVPQGSTIKSSASSKQIVSEASLQWRPSKAASSASELEIYLRDLDRCLIIESDPSVCHQNKPLQKYDEVQKLSWEITVKKTETAQSVTSTQVGNTTSTTNTNETAISTAVDQAIAAANHSATENCKESSTNSGGNLVTSVLGGVGNTLGSIWKVTELLPGLSSTSVKVNVNCP